MFIYRSGALTKDNFTPRPGRDTLGRDGQQASLSTFRTLEALGLKAGAKAQKIDGSKLMPPLQLFPDDPSRGGTTGHISVAPIDSNGHVDQALLEEWAVSRGTYATHRLTQAVLDAVSEQDVRLT